MFKPRKSKVDLTSYYLADASSSNEEAAPALQQIQWPYPGFRPAQSLIFSFSHPDPANSPATAFFLECLPDPVGVAYHGMQFIRTCLVFPGTNPPWRYREVHIKLADEDGLAWACDGVITISLRWASTIMKNFHKGEMDMAACCFEFKGVILHELVHIVQYDGDGTSPGWLTESIADCIRYKGHLGAAHWRAPGSGADEEGWEAAYDVGAMFLLWLMGDLGHKGSAQTPAAPTPTPTPTSAMPAQQTQYPAGNPYVVPPPSEPGQYLVPSQPRRNPHPDIVRKLDTRLRVDEYSDKWWQEMTGASLSQLWAEYLHYYR